MMYVLATEKAVSLHLHRYSTETDSVLYGQEMDKSQQVWMSHGDEAVKLPDGFRCVGKSDAGAVVAIEDPKRNIYGLQYHPEVGAVQVLNPD
jgi:GMP synthase-like glutamine amidotransferase